MTEILPVLIILRFSLYDIFLRIFPLIVISEQGNERQKNSADRISEYYRYYEKYRPRKKFGRYRKIENVRD